jgi:hypothetical protein
MSRFLLLLACFLGVLLPACAPARPVEAPPAQAQLLAAWQASHHSVWELAWPAAPAGGPLTVETWQADGRYRHEILEAAAPALLGATLVFDGRAAYRYNRLNPPAKFTPVEPGLSPVSDALARLSERLEQPATRATQQPAQLNGRPAQLITLTFADDVTLAAWLDTASGLITQIELTGGGQQLRLTTRFTEPLPQPAPELFSVGEWATNPK